MHVSYSKEKNRTLVEDVFLDLKRLSERTCISVRSLRDHINSHSNPLPAYRVRGKILVSWLDFKEWIRGFRQQTGELDAMVNGIIEDLMKKK
jgi:hypothetical protein